METNFVEQKIVDLLKCRDFGTMVNVKGWGSYSPW